MDTSAGSVQEFGRAARDMAEHKYFLQLYIAGSSLRSQRAVANVKNLCSQSLGNDYELQVIDIFQQPNLAKTEQVFAVPTLIKKLPNPRRLFIGDMSDTAAILADLRA